MIKQSLFYIAIEDAKKVEARLRSLFKNNPHIEGLETIEDSSSDHSNHEVRFFTFYALPVAARGHVLHLAQPDNCVFNNCAFNQDLDSGEEGKN